MDQVRTPERDEVFDALVRLRVLDASGAQIQYRTMRTVTARCYVTATD